jgi:hypothetical protein
MHGLSLPNSNRGLVILFPQSSKAEEAVQVYLVFSEYAYGFQNKKWGDFDLVPVSSNPLHRDPKMV